MVKKEKNRCQIFTPQKYARKLLNVVGYKENLYGKSLLENSCGDGAILKEVVERYIADCQKKGRSADEIKFGLEKDIVAFEIDREKLEECIINLNKICKKYKIENVDWNIKNCDSLKYTYEQKFDYIVGNPPYISYRDLTEENREYVKENFKSCNKGKFDYCYAFIESAFNNLNETGKMSYLIPNSIFKNVFGKELRKIIKNSLKEIYDNYPEKVFANATVSPSIIVIDKSRQFDNIKYHNQTTKKTLSISKSLLEGKWIFSKDGKSKDENCVLFSDKYIISNSIATLSNECFLIKEYEDYDENLIKVGDFFIEKTLLKNAVSPSSLSKNKIYKIIYPYYYEEGQLKRYTEEKKFKKMYPYGYTYLQDKKKKLDTRDSDKGIQWYEYGRSQALKNMNKKKLMISIMVTQEINTYELDEGTIPYSGIYITSNKDNNSLIMAKKILNSKTFLDYCKSIGIDSSGDSKRITCNDVKNFVIRGEQV